MTRYDFEARTISELERGWDQILEDGGAGLCKWKSRKKLNNALPLPDVNKTFTLDGLGKENTVLESPDGESVFTSEGKKNWKRKPTLHMEGLDAMGDGSPVVLDLEYYNAIFTDSTCSGSTQDNKKMVIIGGPGAPAKASRLTGFTIKHQGGVGPKNYLARYWLENFVTTGVQYLLNAGDIGGCVELFGTHSLQNGTIIHAWGGRDIKKEVYYINGDGHKATILNTYFAQSAEAEHPATIKNMVRIKDTSPDSEFALLGKIYKHDERIDNIYADQFTYLRCQPRWDEWYPSPS